MPSPKLKEGVWILVANSEKALFLENVGDEVYPNFEVRRTEMHENPPTHEQGADRPGRYTDGPGPRGRYPEEGVQQRSAMGDSDWHELEKERFATELADMLYKRAHNGRFDRIILVADPGVLGSLRRELHPEVQSKVVAEIAKNLTHHPVDRIETLIQEALREG